MRFCTGQAKKKNNVKIFVTGQREAQAHTLEHAIGWTRYVGRREETPVDTNRRLFGSRDGARDWRTSIASLEDHNDDDDDDSK